MTGAVPLEDTNLLAAAATPETVVQNTQRFRPVADSASSGVRLPFDTFSPEAVVTALYHGLLGRAPDEAGLRDHAEDMRAKGLSYVVHRIACSVESFSRHGMADRVKLGLAGNCQVPVIAACLRNAHHLLPLWIADVNERGSLPYDLAVEAFDAGDLDFMLSQPLHSFEEIDPGRLAQLYGERLITFTNVVFTGLQPDMQGGAMFRNTALLSPLGEWHSGIVLACFMQDVPARDCIRRFNGKTYERLGFFHAFAASAEALRQRDARLTVRFADEFIAMTREQLTLFTVNHPTSPVVAALSHRIARAIGVTPADTAGITPASFDNPLEASLTWPVYPEIAEALALPYRTPFRFKAPGGLSMPEFDLEDFVSACYAQYAAWPPGTREHLAMFLLWDV